jgi:MFS family permease
MSKTHSDIPIFTVCQYWYENAIVSGAYPFARPGNSTLQQHKRQARKRLLMLNHPLVKTLLTLRGNPRASVWTEPLWGIPYNLYAPFVSVYMLALGLKDSQIGLIISISLALQVGGAVLGGPITDKMGRRKATFIFDIISWSIPTLIWAFSQNFTHFVAAAVFNSFWRVTHTSWSCLLVEDADPKQLVDIYSWVYIAGLLSAFFAPVAGLLIATFSLVPTMRGLYIFAFLMMTLKFILLWFYSTETKQGEIRLEETRSQSLLSLVSGYGDVLKQVLRTPRTMFTLGIMLAMFTATTVNNTFWAIIVTQQLDVPESAIAYYSFARSIIMLIFFFVAMPRIREMAFRNPMLTGFALLAVSQLILISIPPQSYMLLLVSTFLEACSYAVVSTQMDRLIVINVDAQERARIMALLFLVVIIFTTPFGWIAGQLSEINRILPFVLNIALYTIGGILVLFAARLARKEDAQEQLVAEPEPGV